MGETCRKTSVVTRIPAQRISTSASAALVACMRKKIKDRPRFNPNWTRKSSNPRLRKAEAGDIQTSRADVAIRA